MNRNAPSRFFPWLAAALLVITLAAAGGAAWLRWGAPPPAVVEPSAAQATPAATTVPTDPAPQPSPTATLTPAATATAAATSTATPTTTPAITEYTVQPGDTLGAIAAQFDLTVEELAAYNDLTNPDQIAEGAVLRLPPAEGAPPSLAASPSPTAPPAATADATDPARATAAATPAPRAGTPSAVATIGASYGGRPIEHYVFGDGPAHVAFVGAIHGGYEWNTANLAYAMIDYFEGNPAAVPDAVTLHIVPVANPDGLARVAPGWTSGPIPTPAGIISDTFAGRFNGRDVDLNRNWDCNWQPTGVWRDQVVDAGLAPFSEPETVVLRDLFLETPMQAVVFWHSAAGTVLAGTCAADGHAPSRELAEVYATAAGYPQQLALGYEINGDASDWLTTQDIPSIAIELTDHSRIEWDRNLAGTLAVLNAYAAACAGGVCEGSDR
jgi:LysM repeat protein